MENVVRIIQVKVIGSNSHAISFSYSSISPVSKQFQLLFFTQHNLFITFIGNIKFKYPKNSWIVKNTQDTHNNLHNIQLNNILLSETDIALLQHLLMKIFAVKIKGFT